MVLDPFSARQLTGGGAQGPGRTKKRTLSRRRKSKPVAADTADAEKATPQAPAASQEPYEYDDAKLVAIARTARLRRLAYGGSFMLGGVLVYPLLLVMPLVAAIPTAAVVAGAFFRFVDARLG